MTTLDMSQWPHVCASQLQINPTTARQMLREGKLPRSTFGDPRRVLSNPFDSSGRLAIEACRHHLDTDPRAFATDLLSLSTHLRKTGDEEFPYARGLTTLRVWNIDAGITDTNPAYPIDRYLRPWKKHRVQIFKPELEAAGYSDFAKLFKNPDIGPYGDICGELHLGPVQWVFERELWPELRLPRAEVLERLATIIAQRPRLSAEEVAQ